VERATAPPVGRLEYTRYPPRDKQESDPFSLVPAVIE
jgi:hypothetical protein